MRKALQKGQRISKISVVVLISIFLIEVLCGIYTGSIGLIANGMHSAGDALVSFIVWFGLRLAQREPDERFHYGYHKAETLSALIAAMLIFGIGAVILYESYLRLMQPVVLYLPSLAILIALMAGLNSGVLAIYKLKIAREAGSNAISIDAKNQLKDCFASFIVLIGVLFSTFGFPQMDAIAGVIIALFIFTIVYVTVKESAYILMDACVKCDGIASIKHIAENLKGVRKVQDLKLRSLGPFVMGEMEIAVDAWLSIQEVKIIKDTIEERVKNQFPYITRLTIEVEPYQA